MVTRGWWWMSKILGVIEIFYICIMVGITQLHVFVKIVHTQKM